MDSAKDVPDSEEPNWAYCLLRITLFGASTEIMCTIMLFVFSRNGLVPEPLQTIVDYLVVGAVISGCWAIGTFLLYLWIRPAVHGGSNS